MNFVVLCGDPQGFRATPGDWAHIGILLFILSEHELFGGVDLGNGIRNLEIQNTRRILQPFAVLGTPENLAAVGALAFKHAARIMQAMCEHTNLGVGGRDQLAVEPDEIRTLVEGHCHGIASLASLFPMRATDQARYGAFAPKAQTGYGLRRFLRRSGRACAAIGRQVRHKSCGTATAVLSRTIRLQNYLALAT